MLVRDAMSTVVLTIGPTHTLRQAARLMSARRFLGSFVHVTYNRGVFIITELEIQVAVV
ncbi:CBS domain-containing protein, partial [Streptomyces anulatus]|uniref:CBS domain-containing protein n=1 Tax=Streptomyces anulatus TaxID=1892 RepID=UPI00365A0268